MRLDPKHVHATADVMGFRVMTSSYLFVCHICLSLQCLSGHVPATPHMDTALPHVILSTAVDADVRRTVHGSTLMLRDVTNSDTAVYQCEASNKHGTILVNTYIYIIGEVIGTFKIPTDILQQLLPCSPRRSHRLWACGHHVSLFFL